MTCIVGLIENNKIYIGADSLGSADYNCTTRKDSKVFVKNDFIIGYTSSFRMGQLIRYNFTPSKIYDDQDVFEYMVINFISDLRMCLKNGGYTKIESNKETGGIFIVGYKNRLFSIHSDFQVGESMHSFESVGCGYALALGSLYTTQGNPYKKDNAKKRIITALEAAQEFSNGVRQPFIIKSI